MIATDVWNSGVMLKLTLALAHEVLVTTDRHSPLPPARCAYQAYTCQAGIGQAHNIGWSSATHLLEALLIGGCDANLPSVTQALVHMLLGTQVQLAVILERPHWQLLPVPRHLHTRTRCFQTPNLETGL